MKGKSAVREQQRASEWNKLTRWRHTERGITTMDAVNAVQLFILVWTFTAVCQAEDLDIIVSCENVTGSVGKEVTLTCNVSLQSRDCSTEMGMFRYPNDSVICKQKLPKDSSFTCRYTTTTAMTEKFSFFVQTKCGVKQTEFTVDISDPLSVKTEDPKSKYPIITSVAGCFIIILFIIIITIICKTKPNFTKSCGFQKRMFLCIRHDEDNTTPPETVI
ncbi:uncharacterized protein LOC122139290 [Cyprinus carpio]|uniref:Uncharacterized protein LOC122139290 n=1 Tax=Cyprinus carpio TaxID=7962 RepID=A0A9R0ABH1_CYPCA|nr:uncharacterized protein LOC122139290 [Cyprinus carpio]